MQTIFFASASAKRVKNGRIQITFLGKREPGAEPKEVAVLECTGEGHSALVNALIAKIN